MKMYFSLSEVHKNDSVSDCYNEFTGMLSWLLHTHEP